MADAIHKPKAKPKLSATSRVPRPVSATAAPKTTVPKFVLTQKTAVVRRKSISKVPAATTTTMSSLAKAPLKAAR